jgi:hypothetical protein
MTASGTQIPLPPSPPIPTNTSTGIVVPPPPVSPSPADLIKTASGTTAPKPTSQTDIGSKVVKLTKKYTTPAGTDEAQAEFTVTLDGNTVKSVAIKTLAG